MRRGISLLLCIAFLLSLAGCGSASVSSAEISEPEQYTYTAWDVFDTVTQVSGYAEDEDTWNAYMEQFHEDLLRYHQLFDIYNEYDGINNLATINANAGGDPIEVDPAIIDLLITAKEIYNMTGGKNNVAAGAVLRLWHDARTAGQDDPEHAALPDEDALKEAALHCNMEDLVIDATACTVQLRDSEMSLDVGSIGKGFATEMAAQHLEAAGLESALLNVGGNLRAIGKKPNGKAWVGGVENPWSDGSGAAYLDAVDVEGALVISGDYQRYYTVDGVKYHHLIDLDTLYPADYCNAVAVVCASSTLGDGLSTGLFCMSVEDGLALVEGLDGVEAEWMLPDHSILRSSGFEALLN